jgi:hypothetical protein
MEFLPKGWEVRVLPKFKVYELSLNKDQYVVLAIDVPPEFRFEGKEIGVNTYRANAIVRGAVKFVSATLPDFERRRGDTTLDARLTVKGEYRVQGSEDDSKFVCIMANDPLEKLYGARNVALAPGEEVTFDFSELERNVFIIEGSVDIGLTTHSAFKHLKLTKPQEYTFINNSEENAFLVYMYEVTKEEVKSLYPEVSPEAMASVQILQG